MLIFLFLRIIIYYMKHIFCLFKLNLSFHHLLITFLLLFLSVLHKILLVNFYLYNNYLFKLKYQPFKILYVLYFVSLIFIIYFKNYFIVLKFLNYQKLPLFLLIPLKFVNCYRCFIIHLHLFIVKFNLFIVHFIISFKLRFLSIFINLH